MEAQPMQQNVGSSLYLPPDGYDEAMKVMRLAGGRPITLRVVPADSGRVGFCRAQGEPDPRPGESFTVDPTTGGPMGWGVQYTLEAVDPETGEPAHMTVYNILTGAAEGTWRGLRAGETAGPMNPTRRFCGLEQDPDGSAVSVVETALWGGQARLMERIPGDVAEAVEPWRRQFLAAVKALGLIVAGPARWEWGSALPMACSAIDPAKPQGAVAPEAGQLVYYRDECPWGMMANAVTGRAELWQWADETHLTATEMLILADEEDVPAFAALLRREADKLEPPATTQAPETQGPAKGASSAPLDPLSGLSAKLKAKLGVVPSPPAISLEDFLQRQFPPREYLVRPVVSKQGLVMLHAARGTGKTQIALTIGLGAACGGPVLHNWQAPQPCRVLYIDGEMPANAMQERVAHIVRGFTAEPAAGYFRLITPDLAPDGILPNLATPGGQAALEPLLEGVDLIVVDNLATLARAGKENETESWSPVQAWLLAQRRAGRSVLLVHHSGKSGDQRGTSAREDVLDVVIKLSRPPDYKSDQGARVIVELTKARGITGPEADAFEAVLMTSLDGRAIWATTGMTDVRAKQVRELHALGLSVREIADEVGVPKSTVARILKRLKAAQ